MSLLSSNIKISGEVDQSVRRGMASVVRDLEKLYLLLGQGTGGFSNESPGSVSQDVESDGMGIEGNQGDYRFSPPVSEADVGTAAAIDLPVAVANGGTAAETISGAVYNLGITLPLAAHIKTTYTSGSGTHSFASSSKTYVAIVVGGGGGGAGGLGVSLASGSVAGGGGGGAASVIISGRVDVASVAYVVGAGGAAGSAGNGGGVGGDSSLTHGGYTLSAGGGNGGSIPTGGPGGSVPTLLLNASLFALPFFGHGGGNGVVRSITFSGGLISAYDTAVGKFGYAGGVGGASTNAGRGGDGGLPGGAGGVGLAGAVVIYEA